MIYIIAFVVGVIVGGVYVEWTWNEEIEKQKMKFEEKKRVCKF